MPKTEDNIFLYCFGIKSPDSSSKVLSSSVLRLSFKVASFASNLNILRISLLKKLVRNIRGLKIFTRTFNINEDFVAKLSGLIVAIREGINHKSIQRPLKSINNCNLRY